MLVLHGFWSVPNGFSVWAEDSDRTVKSPSQAYRSARPHPFAAPGEELAAVCPGKPGMATLLLPSVRTAPLDSPQLPRATARPAPQSGIALLPWAVPVLSMDAASAVAFLDEPAADVRHGASLGYLAELAAFARGLVERGRLLPAVRQDEYGA